MKLKKELVDEVIRLNKKYYKTGEVDILPALFKAKDELELKGKTNRYVVDLVGDIAMFTQRSGVGTYENIYKALEAFGVIVEWLNYRKRSESKMKKPIDKSKVDKYMLGGDDFGNLWLMKSKGEVKITPSRAMEWLNAGIMVFDRSKEAMREYIQEQMKEK